MICPVCSHDNIAGTDECAECLASLAQDALPSPKTTAEHSIMTDSVLALGLPEPECVPLDTSAAEAVDRMRARRFGYVLVTDEDGRLVGIFTERDVLYKIVGEVTDLASLPVARYMTRNPTSIPASATIAYALHLQSVHGFRHIPVVDAAGRPLGVLSFRRIGEYIERIA
ncbi:MAG: CBS domain-containing protein [Armatimonadetes bacterium]|nr:CBS domain-containing protein [Armatimonadota bacterium]